MEIIPLDDLLVNIVDELSNEGKELLKSLDEKEKELFLKVTKMYGELVLKLTLETDEAKKERIRENMKLCENSLADLKDCTLIATTESLMRFIGSLVGIAAKIAIKALI